MNKSFITNGISIVLVLVGFFIGSQIVLMIGLFALSGALTNTIAIHMLFEKVPFFYGSGVIEEKFENFKISIEQLIMEQFFTKENIEKFIKNETHEIKLDSKLISIIEKTDFEPAFDSLKNAVLESPFGGMLGMFGGEKALEPLKEPFKNKLQNSIISIVQSESFLKMANDTLKTQNISEEMVGHIHTIVSARLNELTPKMVKEIVQNVIKEHLGWLVLWGGVIGGLIGLISGVFIG